MNVSEKNTTQVWAGFVAVRVNWYTTRFIDEWLTYAQDPRVITDSTSVVKNPTTFKQNRWDQTVLSLLAEKWNISMSFLSNRYLKTHKFDLLKTKFYVESSYCVFY